MAFGKFLKLRFSKEPTEHYLGSTLNMDPYWAFKVIDKALKKIPHETILTLPNIGMTLSIPDSDPQLYFVHFGFHDNYIKFALMLDKIIFPEKLRPFPGLMTDTGGITRNYAFTDSDGDNHMVWAIICGKSPSKIFDEYILAHEEGHAAMVFGGEKELIDTLLIAYPKINRKIVENETNEFKAVVAGLIPFAEDPVRLDQLKNAMIRLNLHEDKDHQKAMFLATTGRATPS